MLKLTYNTECEDWYILINWLPVDAN